MLKLHLVPRYLQTIQRACLLALLLVALVALRGQAPSAKPITKNGLAHALQIGGLSQKELVDQIAKRGVDFRMNTEDEAELRKAGAESPLIDAAKQNYRSGAARDTAGSALAALDAPDSSHGAATESHAAPANSGGDSKRVLTLHEVRKVYIEKMPNGLDSYLRAAISRKLGALFIIVLERSEADAILQSTDPHSPGTVSLVDPSGRVVLWSGSADDKEKAYLGFRHGGQREVAEKLAGQLKRTLE